MVRCAGPGASIRENEWHHKVMDMRGILCSSSAPVVHAQQRNIVCVRQGISTHMGVAVASACLTLILNVCGCYKAAMGLAARAHPYSIA